MGSLPEQARGTDFHDVQAAVTNPDFSDRAVAADQHDDLASVSDTVTLKNIASYAEFTNEQRAQLFATNWQTSTLPMPYPMVFFRGVPAVFTGVFAIPGHNTADQSTYTEELQLQGGSEDRRLRYQAGGYLEWSDPLSTVGNQSSQLAACTDLATLNCTDPIGSVFSVALSQQLGFPVPVNVGAVNYTAGRTTYRSRGIYAQSSYDLAERFTLTGGVRYTWDEQTNSAQRITYNFPVLPPFLGAPTQRCTDPSTAPLCSQFLKQESDKPTWLLGLDYKPGDDVLVYGKYARGYRAGGVFTNAPIDHRTFDPEKVDNFEVGLKTSFRSAVRGLFNIAAFYNDFSDQQLQFGFDARVDPVTGATAPVSPTTAVINAGKSRIYGAEIELSDLAARQGSRSMPATPILKAEIRSIDQVTTVDPNYQVQTSQIESGAPLALSPENKYALSANYALAPAGDGRLDHVRRDVRAHRRATDHLQPIRIRRSWRCTARTWERSTLATCSI